MNENVLTSFTTLLLVSMVFLVGLTLNIQPARASGLIYIRADGSIYPPATPISTFDNIAYVFTGNIIDFSIVVERDNIVVDGSGFTLQGSRDYTGVSLTNRTNVTIRNLEISGCNNGISLDHSSHNIISENNITNNVDAGIDVSNSPDNIFSGNNIINNTNYGVDIQELSNNNSIIGNNITSSTNGMYVAYSSGNTIFGNNMMSCADFGILLQACQSNNLIMNMMSNIGRGIYTSYCSHNNITGNTILNSLGGIWLDLWSRDNILRNNNMSGNHYNFGVNPYHMDIKFWIHDVDVSNTVNGKPIYYWIDKRNVTVPLDAGQVTLVNCTWITVQNLTLTNNWQGIQLASTTDSAITNNNIANNWDGVKIHIRSSNNNISGNTIANNVAGVWLGYSSSNNVFLNDITNNHKDVGIYEDTERGGIVLRGAKNHCIFENNIANNVFGIEHIHSSNNYIYHNNITSNVQQVYSPYGNTSWVNSWDRGYPSGGNYWSDYTGVDVYGGLHQNETGFDWIGDSPYVIDQNNIDNYPLMLPFAPEMEEEARMLLVYRSLMFRFNEMYSDFRVLNSTVQKLIGNITDLQGRHDYLENMVGTLQEQVSSLNVTVSSVQSSLQDLASILNTTFGSLQLQINSLNQVCTSLNQSLASLQAQTNSINSTLQASINDLQARNTTLSNQLDDVLNVLYVLTVTTIVLAVAAVYFIIRRPKTKQNS